MTTPPGTPRSTGLAAVALCLSTGVLAGCGSTDSPEPGAGSGTATATGAAGSPSTSAERPAGDGSTGAYDGAYDERFRAGLSSYSGQRVSLTGEVRDLIRSRSSYELADPGDPDLDPLLVSAQYAVPELEEGDAVRVTGTLREAFEAPVVEEAVEGGEEAGFYDQHIGEPYLDGAQVEVVDPAGG